MKKKIKSKSFKLAPFLNSETSEINNKIILINFLKSNKFPNSMEKFHQSYTD